MRATPALLICALLVWPPPRRSPGRTTRRPNIPSSNRWLAPPGSLAL